jgi:hypothetical protein
MSGYFERLAQRTGLTPGGAATAAVERPRPLEVEEFRMIDAPERGAVAPAEPPSMPRALRPDQPLRVGEPYSQPAVVATPPAARPAAQTALPDSPAVPAAAPQRRGPEAGPVSAPDSIMAVPLEAAPPAPAAPPHDGGTMTAVAMSEVLEVHQVRVGSPPPRSGARDVQAPPMLGQPVATPRPPAPEAQTGPSSVASTAIAATAQRQAPGAPTEGPPAGPAQPRATPQERLSPVSASAPRFDAASGRRDQGPPSVRIGHLLVEVHAPPVAMPVAPAAAKPQRVTPPPSLRRLYLRGY